MLDVGAGFQHYLRMEIKQMSDVKEETAQVLVFPAGPLSPWQGWAGLEAAARQDIEDACAKAGVPMAVAGEPGRDLGPALAEIFESAFARGVDRVLVVFSDTAGFTDKRVAQALDVMVRYGGVSLGPSQDGRFYLLGLSKDAYDPAFFQPLAGDEPGSFTALMQGFADQGKAPTFLPGQGRIGNESQARTLAEQAQKGSLAGTHLAHSLANP